MNTTIIAVEFDNDNLALIDHEGEPFVAMRPLVSNMGLDWGTQNIKLNDKFNSTVGIIPTVGGDGKKRDMACLPLRKIPAWLYSINPNKVKPELKDKIVRYQEECDDVLWEYWTKGHVSRDVVQAPNTSQQLAAGKERTRLLKELKKETHPEIRLAISQQIEHASNIMGVSTPELSSIGRSISPAEPDPVIDNFWDAVELIGLDKINHSNHENTIAINLIHFTGRANDAKVKVPTLIELRRNLKDSQSPAYIKQEKIYSRILKKPMSCWVFTP